MSATAKVDNALVFSNKDGTKKAYLMHFHDLSREGWQSLMQDIKNHNTNITYLMTKSEYKNLVNFYGLTPVAFAATGYSLSACGG